MYELFYFPRNASLAPHFMLEEIGAPFELRLVDRKSEGQKDPDYMKLNPMGRIPTLVDGELVLFESAAICLHLADMHPEAGLVPALGTAQRAHCYKWLMFLMVITAFFILKVSHAGNINLCNAPLMKILAYNSPLYYALHLTSFIARESMTLHS